MKCVSLYQPWATLVVLGAKRYETRSWATEYRGRLGIHASRTWRPECEELCRQESVRRLLRAAGYRSTADLPRGALLGTVELVDCVATEFLMPEDLGAEQRRLGDFRPGRFAWKLLDPVRLAAPLRLCGQLGVFDADVPGPAMPWPQAAG